MMEQQGSARDSTATVSPDSSVCSEHTHSPGSETTTPARACEPVPSDTYYCGNAIPETSAIQRYHVFRHWKEQIICTILSSSLVVAMVVILLHYDRRPVPDWGLPINLNTLLALLSTILRALITVVLSRIISQAKWQWFGGTKERPLRHLQDFDDGSRGALGAVRLLRTALQGNVLACGAAFLIISSFATSPFVQQAMKTMECESPIGGTASIPYARYVPRQGGYVRGVNEWAPADPDTNVMVCSSLTAPVGIENQIHPSCTTGNCSFPFGDLADSIPPDVNGHPTSLHSTVGLCHSCEDITSLVASDIAGYYSLPNGQRIVANRSDGSVLNVTTNSDLFWMKDIVSAQFSIASRWSYANLTILTTSTIPYATIINTNTSTLRTDPAQRSVRASTCVLYPCLQTYTTSIKNNELLEKFVNSSLMFPTFSASQAHQYNGRTNDLSDYTAVFLPCNASDGSTPTQLDMCETLEDGSCGKRTFSYPETCIYRHSAKFGSAISQVLQDNYLTGGCNATSETLNCRTKSSGEGPGRDKFLESLYSRPDLMDPWSGNATTESIEAYFGTFATAMTNGYRARFGSSEYDAEKARNNVLMASGIVPGVVWHTTVCTSVQLHWLIFPGLLVISTGALLVWGVWQSWRLRRTQPVWRDSVLPFLFYPEFFRPAAAAFVTAEEENHVLLEADAMEKLAKDVSVIIHWPKRPSRTED